MMILEKNENYDSITSDLGMNTTLRIMLMKADEEIGEFKFENHEHHARNVVLIPFKTIMSSHAKIAKFTFFDLM